jgi:hypothetical protein
MFSLAGVELTVVAMAKSTTERCDGIKLGLPTEPMSTLWPMQRVYLMMDLNLLRSSSGFEETGIDMMIAEPAGTRADQFNKGQQQCLTRHQHNITNTHIDHVVPCASGTLDRQASCDARAQEALSVNGLQQPSTLPPVQLWVSLSYM